MLPESATLRMLCAPRNSTLDGAVLLLYVGAYRIPCMDDVTRKFLEGMEGRIAAKADGIRHDVIVVNNKLDVFKEEVAAGFAAVDAGLDRFDGRLTAIHGEQMRRFQSVVDAAERIGASEARDARLTALEGEVAELRSKLEALLRGQGSAQ
jgi:hypothetical protein